MKTSSAVAALLVGLGIVAAVVFYFWKERAPAETSALPPRVAYAVQGPVEVRYSFTDGTHQYAGELPIGGCDSLATGLSVKGEEAPSVLLSLNVVRAVKTCEDTATSTQEFLATIALKTKPPFAGVEINGAAVPFRVVEEE